MDTANLSPKSDHIHRMFTAVPPRYDLINHIMTFGQDIRWRRLAAKACLEKKPQRVLDLGCGTGDLTINIARSAGKGVEVTGVDFSQPMLELAEKKAAQSGVGEKVKFVYGEATNLPFPDGHFDCVGISFAFRNLTYKNPVKEKHLSEVFRVLKRNGRYVIVESSQPANRTLKTLFNLFLRGFVAPVGSLISNNRGAYKYLAESVSHFYSPPEVKQMLLTAGFSDVSYRPLVFGTAGIHIATK